MNRASFQAPALRGNDALGFLASLGVISMVEQAELGDIRLSWSGGVAPIATFHSADFRSLEELASALRREAERMHKAEEAIPRLPASFPYKARHPSDTATGVDAMRMSKEAARETYLTADSEWRQGNQWMARWLLALLSLVSQDRAGKAVRVTPFNAPFGRMKFRDSYFDQGLNYVLQKKDRPLDAFVGWEREEGYTGANLDERAIRDGAVTTDGSPRNAGAPSPTWLAVMAIRFFPIADAGGGNVTVVGWHDFSLYPNASKRTFVWPLWEPPLDPAAIRTLLAHPAVHRLDNSAPGVRPAAGAQLRALGVTALFGASRRTRTQGDGPLGPAVRIWP